MATSPFVSPQTIASSSGERSTVGMPPRRYEERVGGSGCGNVPCAPQEEGTVQLAHGAPPPPPSVGGSVSSLRAAASHMHSPPDAQPDRK